MKKIICLMLALFSFACALSSCAYMQTTQTSASTVKIPVENPDLNKVSFHYIINKKPQTRDEYYRFINTHIREEKEGRAYASSVYIYWEEDKGDNLTEKDLEFLGASSIEKRESCYFLKMPVDNIDAEKFLALTLNENISLIHFYLVDLPHN